MAQLRRNPGYEQYVLVEDIHSAALPLFVTIAGWSIWKKGNCYEMHNTAELVLSLNVYGTLKVIQDNQEYCVSQPGEVLILRPGSSHYYWCDSDFHADRYVTLCGPLVPQLLQMTGLSSTVTMRLQSATEAQRLLVKIWKIISHHETDCARKAAALSFELLLLLAQANNVHLPQPVAAITGFLNSNLHKQVTNAMVCDSVGLSRAQAYALFKESLGTSPLTYHHTRRMEMAKSLLIRTSKSIKTIAASVGYNDQLYFSRDFKKATGECPRKFRQKMR